MSTLEELLAQGYTLDTGAATSPTPSTTPAPANSQLQMLLQSGYQLEEEPSMLDRALRYGGLGVRGAMEGTAGLLGTAADLAELLVPGPRSLMMDQADYSAKKATSLADSLTLPTADPNKFDERLAENVGAFVPDAAIPIGGGLTRRALSSLGGAFGLTTAEGVAPESPLVQALGAMTGSAAPDIVEAGRKLGKTAVRGGVRNDQELRRAVGGMIADRATDQELAAAERAKRTASDPFVQFQTTAELTQNPRLAALEDTAKTLNAEDYAVRQLARDEKRISELARVQPGVAPSAEEFGTTLRAVTESAYKKSQKAINKLYRSIDPKDQTQIDTKQLRSQVRRQINTFANMKKFNPQLKGTASELVAELMRKEVDKDAVTQVLAAMEDGTMTPATIDELGGMLAAAEEGVNPQRSLQDLINLRSTSYQIANKLEAAGDMKQALVMQDLAASVNATLDRAATTGEIGAEQLAKLRQADKQFGRSKELYDSGVIKSQVRAENVDPSVLGRRALDFSPATVRKLKTAIAEGSGSSREASRVLRDYRKTILAELSDQATSVTGEVTPGAMRRALRMRSRMPMLKELFEPSHIRRLERLYGDLLSQEKITRYGRAASRGQSVTAQRLTQAESIMGNAMLGAYDKIPGLGPMLRLLRTQAGEERAKQIIAKTLFDAAMEPTVARDLLRLSKEPVPPQLAERLLAELPLSLGIASGAGLANQ